MSQQNEVNLLSLMSAIKQSWLKLVLFSALAALATFIILKQMAPRYVSESRVLVSPITSYQNPAAGRSQEAVQTIDVASVLSQIQVIQSRDIIGNVIRNYGLLEDEKFQSEISEQYSSLSQDYKDLDPEVKTEVTINLITKNMQVVSLSQSRVIGIRYHSSNPVRAAGIANSIAAAYIDWQRSEKVQQNQDDSVRLSRLIADLKKEVEKSEAAVAEYRAKKGIYKTSSNDVTLNRQQLTELNSRIIAARERRAESEIRAKLIREMLNQEGQLTNAPDTMRSQLIQRLFEQKTRVQRTMSELGATLLPSHPRLKQLTSELRGINQQIRSEMRRIVLSIENDAKIARAREESLQKSLNDLKDQSSQSDGDEIQLRALEREAKTNQELLNTYLTRFRDAKARKDSAVAPAYATIVSKAHIPVKPYFPRPLPFALLAFVAALIIGLGIIIMRAVLRGESYADTTSNQSKEDYERNGETAAT